MRMLWVFLTVALIAAACGTSSATPPPAPQSPAASRTPLRTDAASPTATTSAAPEPAIGVGSAVVTVSDGLRVRSVPGVSDDSVKYQPLLPLGTELLVVGGPVAASGYVWWQVEPMSFALEEATVGWVAMADHDGSPWIALAGDANPALGMAMSDVARMPVRDGDARTAAQSLSDFGFDLSAWTRAAVQARSRTSRSNSIVRSCSLSVTSRPAPSCSWAGWSTHRTPPDAGQTIRRR